MRRKISFAASPALPGAFTFDPNQVVLVSIVLKRGGVPPVDCIHVGFVLLNGLCTKVVENKQLLDDWVRSFNISINKSNFPMESLKQRGKS